MNKQEMISWLAAFPDVINPSFRIYVRSVRRSGGIENVVYHKVLNGLPEKFWDIITYCIKPSEYEYYKATYPNIKNYIWQPEYEPTRTQCGAGVAWRNILLDAVAQRYQLIALIDDDVKAIECAYEGLSGAGEVCSKHTTVDDHENQLDAILLNAALYMAYHAATVSGAVGIHLRRQRFSQAPEVATTAYTVNKGCHPRQFMFWHTGVLDKDDVCRLVPPDVAWSGDDIVCGAMLTGVAKQNIATIQCIMFDYVSEQQSSAIRSEDEYSDGNKAIHAYEGAVLKKYGLDRFVKPTKLYPDGTPMYFTLNWRAIGLKGARVSIEALSKR